MDNEAKRVILVWQDGKPIKKFHCPGCKVWGEIDNDQLHGRVSIQCDCGFHETINLSKEL